MSAPDAKFKVYVSRFALHSAQFTVLGLHILEFATHAAHFTVYCPWFTAYYLRFTVEGLLLNVYFAKLVFAKHIFQCTTDFIIHMSQLAIQRYQIRSTYEAKGKDPIQDHELNSSPNIEIVSSRQRSSTCTFEDRRSTY